MSALPIVALLGYALLVSCLIGKRVELMLAPAASVIIMLLLAAGAFELLGHVYWILLAGGPLALAFTLKRFSSARSALLTPGVVLFVAAAMVVYGHTYERQHLQWDAFSHWGLVPKVLIATDALPQRWMLNLQDYPLGAGVFGYFIARAAGFSEGRTLFAQGVLQLVALAPLFALSRWRDVPLLIALCAVCLSAGYLFSPLNWQTVLIDNVLSAFFATPILIYLMGGRDVRSISASIPVVAVLPLLKDMGLFFGLAGIAVVVAVHGVSAIMTRSREPRAWAALAISLLALVASSRLWAAYLGHAGATPTFRLSREQLIERIVDPKMGEKLYLVTSRWWDSLGGSMDMGFGLGVPFWLATLATLAAAALLVCRSWRDVAVVATTHLVLLGVSTVYVTILLVSYLFLFSDYEGRSLASFGRYVGNMLFAWVLIGAALLVPDRESGIGRKAAALAAMVALAVWLGYPLVSPGFMKLTWRGLVVEPNLEEMIATRKVVREALGSVPDSIPDDASVYSVWNDTQGLEHFITTYEMKPRRTNFMCFSLGPRRAPDDVWSCPQTVDGFRKVMNDYDYLFIGRADEVFWKHFGRLFVPGEHGAAWYQKVNGQDGVMFVEISTERSRGIGR